MKLIPTPSPVEILKALKVLQKWLEEIDLRRLRKIQTDTRMDTNLFEFLAFYYRDCELLSHNERYFPVALFPAPKPQRYDPESVLGNLDEKSVDEIDERFEKIGQAHIAKLKKLGKEIWNDPTYRLIKLNHEKMLKVYCAIGSYYNAVKTQDIVLMELLSNFDRLKPKPEHFEAFREKLVLRNYLHSLGDLLEQPRGISSAVSISMLIVFLEQDSYWCFLRERSSKVAVYPNFLHVIPSFMFQPIIFSYHDEYSIKHNIYREYLEELLNIKEVKRRSGQYGYDYFYENPNLKYLRDMEDKGDARFFFTGLGINLEELRLEICTLLIINDPNWIVNQRRGSKVGAWQLDKINVNWEFKRGDEANEPMFRGLLALPLKKEFNAPDIFRPENFVPPGAAALKLGLDVAKEEIGNRVTRNGKDPCRQDR